MKWGVKKFLRALALLVLLLALFYLSYKLLSTPKPVDSHNIEYAYVPNGRSDNLSIINTATNEIEYSIDVGDDPEGVAITPDGAKVYVTNSYLNSVSVIDIATNSVIAKVPVGYNPMGIAVSPDGKKVYVANMYSDNVSVIDTSKNIIKYSLGVQINPIGIAITSDGKKVYVANYRSSTVSVIDTEARSVIEDVNLPDENPYGVAVTPDGTKVYVTHDDSNNISIINTSTHKIKSVQLDTGQTRDKVKLCPHGVAVSPDGKKVYVANHKTPIRGISDTPCGSVSIIDTKTDTPIDTLGVDKCPCGVSVNKDGTKIYVANSGSNTVSVIDTVNKTEIANVPVGDMPSALGQFISSPKKVPKYNFIWEYLIENIGPSWESFSNSVSLIWNNKIVITIIGFVFTLIGFVGSVTLEVFRDDIKHIVKSLFEPIVTIAKSLFEKK